MLSRCWRLVPGSHQMSEYSGGDPEEVTGLVCQEADLKDGEMREVTVAEQKVLLVRTNGQYSAVGSRCSHYSAPLIKGVLVGDRVRCPFHGACFSVTTGDIEEYPGLDSLPKYKVKVQDGAVYVSITKESLKETRRVKEMCTVSADVPHTTLLIGGGPASLVCAETLRQNVYRGRVVIITKDKLPPFDKPKLSKALNVDSSKILLRSADFLHQHGIEVWTQKEVVDVCGNNIIECREGHIREDTDAWNWRRVVVCEGETHAAVFPEDQGFVVSVSPTEKTVKLSDDTSLHYDRLLVATGCRSRPLNCPGKDLKGVKLLQNCEDAKEIHGLGLDRKAVIVGASFIGMEVASYLSGKAASVVVVGSGRFPYERSLGPEIGKMTKEMLEERNVKFYMNDSVVEIRGENGQVTEVALKSGLVLQADLVVAGIGAIPNSDFLAGAGVDVDSRKAVIVDKFMRTNVQDIFAAGDVTSFPLTVQGDRRVNVGHWQMSQAHGRVAALNMLNKPTEINSVPFFWTVLLGKSIRYTGYAEGYTEIIFKGKMEERKFLAFYIKDEVVVAGAGFMFDPLVAQLAEMMAAGQPITKEQVQAEDLSWLRK